jgi:predicted heme/steroid binding protein
MAQRRIAVGTRSQQRTLNQLASLTGGIVLGNAEREFTPEQLKQYDGKQGRPAYIAYKGKVYDVTDSYLWTDGDHQGQHAAGRDLTEEIVNAPHGEETLERIKPVGTLILHSGE